MKYQLCDDYDEFVRTVVRLSSENLLEGLKKTIKPYRRARFEIRASKIQSRSQFSWCSVHILCIFGSILNQDYFSEKILGYYLKILYNCFFLHFSESII
jgi:hypothetical protein